MLRGLRVWAAVFGSMAVSSHLLRRPAAQCAECAHALKCGG